MPQEPKQADTQDTFDHSGIFRMASISAEGCKKRLLMTESGTVPLFSSEGVHEALQKESPVLIVYRAAIPFLTNAMQDGQVASAALEAWQSVVAEILAVKKRARRKILLIEEATLLRGGADASSLKTVMQWLGQETLSSPVPLDDAEKTDPVLSALAAQLLTRAQQAQQKEQDLEACAVPQSAEAGIEQDIDAGFELYTQMRDAAALLPQIQKESKDQNAKAQSEDALLKGHIKELQDEIQGYVSLKAEMSNQAQRMQGLEAELQATRETAASFDAERNLLLLHLAELQAELSGHFKSAEEFKQQLEKAGALRETHTKVLADVRVMTTDIAGLKKQREASEKQATVLTAQLKESQSGKAAVENAAATAKAENTLVLRHLHELQQEADLYQQRITQDEAQLAKLQSAYTQESSDNTARYQALRSELAQKVDAIGQNTLSQIARLQEYLANQENRLNAAIAERGQLSLQVENLQHEIQVSKAHWEGQLQLAKQYEQVLTEKLDGAHIEYDRLIASRSWKVTRPLRTANMIVGQAKKKDT